MVSGRINSLRWAMGVLAVVMLCFTFGVDVRAELVQAMSSPAPRQTQLNARAVAYSPSHHLIQENKPDHTEGFPRPRIVSVLPDMASAKDVHSKKDMFFSFLLPLVVEENEHLHNVRQRLIFIQDHVRWGQSIDTDDSTWLCLVCDDFKIEHGDFTAPDFWEKVLRRVDEVPENLVLVQAANESAWGTSRFAREANNLFGQWCFHPDCGLVPRNRPEGATYQVAQFSSIGESVRSYMHNLNTGRSYAKLRNVRARMRDESKEPDASDMAGGLVSYSERGMDYVNEIRSMLRHNHEVIADVKSRMNS
jgi:Bax protein